MNRNTITRALALSAWAWTAWAGAATSADETSQLGTSLTEWGAVKGGNADGSIPAYTGGIQPPANYDPKKPNVRPDPYAAEKPLISINAGNMDRYADKLGDGVKAMLKKYPTFRIDVYPTHRTARYPKLFLENSVKNAGTCKLTENQLSLSGTCWAGMPFPLPKSGAEVVWNRVMKYDSYATHATDRRSILVDAKGHASMTAAWDSWEVFPAFDPARTTPLKPSEIGWYARFDFTAPARKAGESLVLHDSIDMVTPGRRVWQYLPGQRRVKLAPDVAYDAPAQDGGGIGTVDEAQVYYGAIDRYDFKLVGKKEMFIPYNTFKLNDGKACPESGLYTPNHLNPECVRWELHRVWVVDATLKPGKRHLYPRRVFYFDEDMPMVGIADNYDDAGKLYRVTWMDYVPFYESTGHRTNEYVKHDLVSGAYVRADFTPADAPQLGPVKSIPASMFDAQNLSSTAIR